MAYLTQFSTPLWWPFSFRLGGRHGFAYCQLPAGRFICWNLGPDHDERVEFGAGLLTITRMETEEEEQERLYAEEEEAYLANIADHYSY
jgi:hypothetical protein